MGARNTLSLTSMLPILIVMSKRNIALIVAAGKGKRFGGEVPKQYQLLNGKPILAHSIEAFLNHPEIDTVKVVINKEHEELYRNIAISLYDEVGYCFGGEERQDSVKLGLQGLDCDNVLIHDAARPYVSHETISTVLTALEKHNAAIPVISAKDSARYQGQAINRDELKFVQTPQGFRYDKIFAAHMSAQIKYTDDAQVAEAYGLEVALVEGDEMNIKITNQADIVSSIRVGQGFDVHAFEDGDHVTICGIKIPHNKSLKGHSDADVGLHAITDAVLGAIGKGDIGEHFPPSDPKWENADSAMFLQHAVSLAKCVINNIDLTIICEEPKLSAYKQEMQENTAKILNISISKVNIKATTTEKLGFLGRGEGIAAQAIATVILME